MATALSPTVAVGTEAIGTPSPTAIESTYSTPVPGATIGPDILNPQGVGVTLTMDDATGFQISGGTYRLAWYTKGCTYVQVGLTVGDWHDPNYSVPVDLPGGQRIITNVPAGIVWVDRGGSCPVSDLVVRFEKMP